MPLVNSRKANEIFTDEVEKIAFRITRSGSKMILGLSRPRQGGSGLRALPGRLLTKLTGRR